MNRRKPAVSVCIPTCNRAAMLGQAIESVLCQRFTDYELIISDNASKDNTEAIVNSLNDSRIRYIKNEKNIGPINNFNQCLALANGQYITIFHDDDLMLPDNLTLKVRALDLNKNVGLVHSNFHIIDENGSITRENAHFIQSQDFVETGTSFLRKSLLGINPVNAPSVVICKECFSKVGGFNKEIHYTTDFEYWMRISMHYDIMYLATPLIKYRIYQNGWGSSRYTTIVDGEMINNLRGLQEEYVAKKIILQQTKDILYDWKNLNRLVRKRMIGSIKLLVEKKYLGHGEKIKVLKTIIQVCREFPDLMYEISIAKLMIKVLLGLRITAGLKRLLTKEVEGI